MQQATTLFTEVQRRQVEQAVVQAESKTACEIVPVVASASGRYDRAEDILGLWLAIAAAVAVWLVLPRQVNAVGDWSGTPIYVGVIAMIAAAVSAFLLGAVIGSRIAALRRLFTPRLQMAEEVAAKARQIFFDNRVHHTAGATGLLFYVSLFEHRAVVLGDQEILEKLGQPFLDQLCHRLTDGLRGGDATAALCTVIAEAGSRLAEVLPRAKDDVDELHNTLVLID